MKGKTPPARRQSFEVAGFVELIPQFMDALGIGSVPIMGTRWAARWLWALHLNTWSA